MKKRRSLVIGLCFALVCLFALNVSAHAAQAGGTCGKSISWTLSDEGTLTYSMAETAFQLSGLDFSDCIVTVKGVNTLGVYDYGPVDLKML